MKTNESKLRAALVAAAAALVLAVAVVGISSALAARDADAAGIPKPANHDAAWRQGHSTAAKADARGCYSCHDQSYCTGCHNSDNPKEGFHKTNYVYTHYLDKYLDEKDCSACHDRQDFCNACHETTRATPGGGRPPNHHDPGWSAQGHAAVAPYEIDSCAACHDPAGADPVCMQCHRTGVSPHGSDTVTRMGKGPWHEDKGYVCYRCHGESEDFCGKCHEDEGGDGGGPDRR